MMNAAMLRKLLGVTQTPQHGIGGGKGGSGNPLMDFLSSVTGAVGNVAINGINAIGNAGDAIQNNPQVQQIEKSPLSQLLQGNYSQVIPAAKQEIADINSGKYSPQLSIGGEMEEVPGGGFNPATGLPKSPVRVVLKPSVYGAGRESQVQNTVDTIVPGATATEKYNNLQPTMSNLGNQIEDIMAKDPKNASLDQVLQDYDKNLQNEGVYRTARTSKNQVQQLARNYITDLQNESAAESSGSTIPNQISDVGLQRIKQQVNQDAQSIYKKIENGTSLTDKDKVILSARQTLDDTITNLHPEVKTLTSQQSHLYDSADSLFKAREAEVKAAQQPPQDNGNILGNILKGSISSPGHVLATAGILSGLGVGGYGAYLGMSQPKTYTTTGGDVTLPGLSQITDSRGNSLTKNVADYNNGISDINQKESAIALQVQLGIPSAVAQHQQLENQKQTLQTQYATTKPILDQYTETSNQIQGLTQAQQLIKNANPQWFQAFGPVGTQLTGLRAALVPGYAQFSEQLKTLHDQFGIDPSVIMGAASPQDADAAINQAITSYKSKLENTIQQNGGVLPTKNVHGGEIIQHQANQIISPISTPASTPTPEDASPTPDFFQQLLHAKLNTSGANPLQGQ